MTIEEFSKLKLPDSPGVYFFNNGRKILYIGRATSLRDRVRSYFANDLIVTRGPRIVDMTVEATTVTYKTVGSVLEAIIMEANLIKEHQPIYNTKEKDDKSFNYVVITEEEFPRVLLIRGRDLAGSVIETREVFGPYPQGGILREVLKIVRKMFPYRDTCLPATPGEANKPCFNRQIGRCPGVCTGEISAKEYKKTIERIQLLFRGNITKLKSDLNKDMLVYAGEQKFEMADTAKRALFNLEHIQDIALIKDDVRRYANQSGYRIEAYDIAHMGGQDTIGVMTVLTDGMADKREYKKFKIRGKTGAKGGNNSGGNDDTGNLVEILTRRFNHPEWGIPDLIVIDGGKGQMNAVKKLFQSLKISIPTVAVTKDEYHRPKAIIGDSKLAKDKESEILLANAEAHRFAIAYHKNRRGKSFLQL